MSGSQDIDETVLSVVGVLVLVHVDVLETRLVAFAELGEEFEEGDGLHDQAVEVNGGVFVETPLVEVVALGDVLGYVALRIAEEVVGGHKDVLGGADLSPERTRVEALWVLAELHDAPFDEPDLVRAV